MTNRDTKTVPWELIRAFLALHRHGDFMAASELIGIDDSTLRRRIRSLEQFFGRALFIRDSNKWVVSPDQGHLVEIALAMESAGSQFSRNEGNERGTVRLSMLDISVDWFRNAFVKIQEMYPSIILNISTESHFVDLEHDQIDIAIRLARPRKNSENLRIKKIGTLSCSPYASHNYWDRYSTSAMTGAKHKFLDLDVPFPHHDHDFAFAVSQLHLHGIEGEVAARSSSFLVLMKLCEMGLGVAILPDCIASKSPALRRMGGGKERLIVDAWIVSRFDLKVQWQRDLIALLQDEMLKLPKVCD